MNTNHIVWHKNRQVVQADVRLKRIKERAEGIRFALIYEDITFRQRKELEQTPHNLESVRVD